MKILLDTDPGSDIDDLLALAYLLSRPDAEIVGVTVVTGRPKERADLVCSLAQDRGTALRVNAGYRAPLAIAEHQPNVPHASAASRSFDHDLSDPADFLADVLDAHAPKEVTLLAIGGLTNVARFLARRPASAARLLGITLMNGQFVEDWAEWNVQCDPDASARVYRQTAVPVRAVGGCQTFRHGVDREAALAFVPAWAGTLRRGMDVWFESNSLMYFHDPIAAADIFGEGHLTFTQGDVTMRDDRTLFHANPLGNVKVATDWDIEPSLAHLRSTLGG